jgi:bifunctional UDP-N-acetylglucosamine pyrophosphorylase/glucosamine-1-phosphate N-acetyltransferase
MIQAVIMAAGKSTRTYPLTLTKPKPLLHIANKPILAHQLDQCIGLVHEAIIIVGYRSDMIREHFGDTYRGIRLVYVEQREQLGTGHAAMQVRPYIRDRFLLMNGDDLYAREDIEGCLRYHYSLLGRKVADPRQYGVLTVENGLVTDLIEKPEHPASNLTSVGMYVFDGKIFTILDKIPKSPRGEYEVTDAVKQLAQIAEVHCHISSGYWIPVGFPWSLLNANDFMLTRYFEDNVSKGAIEPGVTIDGQVWLGENSVIRQGTYIQGKLCIGKHCTIGPNCHISGNTSIGDHSDIAASTRIKNSVIEKHVRIEPFCHLSHSVVGEHATVHSGAVTMSAPIETKTVTSLVKGHCIDSGREQLGAILGAHVTMLPHVVTYPGVKIAPKTIIAPGTVVQHDLL